MHMYLYNNIIYQVLNNTYILIYLLYNDNENKKLQLQSISMKHAVSEF
jgi:hypothetical protein